MPCFYYFYFTLRFLTFSSWLVSLNKLKLHAMAFTAFNCLNVFFPNSQHHAIWITWSVFSSSLAHPLCFFTFVVFFSSILCHTCTSHATRSMKYHQFLVKQQMIAKSFVDGKKLFPCRVRRSCHLFPLMEIIDFYPIT